MNRSRILIMRNSLFKLWFWKGLVAGLALLATPGVAWSQNWDTSRTATLDATFAFGPSMPYVPVFLLDSSKVFIAYTGNGTYPPLKFVSSADGGNTWNTPKTVDSNGYMNGSASIFAINDPAATVGYSIFIVYHQTWVGWSNDVLRVAKSTDGGITWNISQWIESIGGATGYVGNTSIFAVNDAAAPAGYSIFVIYYHRVNADLKYARSTNGGATWSVFTLDSIGNVGYYNSIYAIDTNNIFVSYLDSSNYKVRFQKFDKNLTSIILRDVDNSVGLGNGSNSIFAIDTNNISISYSCSDGSNASLKFAKSTDGGNAWPSGSIKTIATAPVDYIYSPSIRAVDFSNIMVGYINFQGSYAVKSVQSIDGGINWQSPELVDNVFVRYTAGAFLYILDSNNIFISYFGGSPSGVKLAKYLGGGSVDCGLRMYDGTSTVTISCENPAVTQCGSVGSTDSLCINTQNKKYGIKLVDPADANASRIRLQTPAGIKALRRQ